MDLLEKYIQGDFVHVYHEIAAMGPGAIERRSFAL
jgi:hypothetical protein